MEFSNNSNLRSLIPAVLVGLMALAANAYTKMDQKALRDAVNVFEQKINELNQPEKRVPDPRVRLANLQDLDSSLTEKYAIWKKHRFEVPAEELEEIVEQSDRICQRIEDAPNSKPKMRRRALLTQLSILFKVAQMNPEVFTERFESATNKIIAQGFSEDIGHSTILRFYHQTNFSEPDGEVLLARLKEFSDEHVSSLTIRLYSLVAEELVSRGRQTLARDVLKQGIRDFTGVPGSSRLTNQLIGLDDVLIRRTPQFR